MRVSWPRSRRPTARTRSTRAGRQPSANEIHHFFDRRVVKHRELFEQRRDNRARCTVDAATSRWFRLKAGFCVGQTQRRPIDNTTRRTRISAKYSGVKNDAAGATSVAKTSANRPNITRARQLSKHDLDFIHDLFTVGAHVGASAVGATDFHKRFGLQRHVTHRTPSAH